jgi:diphthamide synthase subunit DPH2
MVDEMLNIRKAEVDKAKKANMFGIILGTLGR